ncbi:MAG: bacteriohopanetetrol glucosamine biosynthesis glycosyltransferase HpnI [Rhizomicrobium sp.]|nr:bacteriohopanetetrol glucosamine biosynthesis glycosyltransferase HpnI [Rhizomicrobium sp.]
MLLSLLGWLCVALAFAGAAYAVLSAWFVRRFGAEQADTITTFAPLTVLKPLHGDEPALAANLESFFVQDYPAPFQIVFGVQDPSDAAIAVVEALQARYPQIDTVLVCDAARHGSNPKISNLVNMECAIAHDVVVLSDSDIAVEPDYLRRVAAALSPPVVGAVTCLYTGWGASGLVSRLSAMGVSYHFLPNVITGLGLHLAAPCFGSTIAIKRPLLTELGGFVAFADLLADDNAIGKAVRDKGYVVAIPAFAVRHAATETALAEWFSHELRWMRTIRTVDPGGHAGSIVTHAFPLSLLGLMLTGAATLAIGAVGATLLARALLKWHIDKVFLCPAGPYWLLPLRDVVSFVVFLTSLFGGSVVWQNERLEVRSDGALAKR